MHQHSNRKRQIAIRSFIYGIMTMATIFAVTISIMFVLGYQFNRTSGRFEQGSLLQFRSFPSDANVVIDGKVQGFTTPDKKNVSAGNHNIAMQREGYNDWSRSIHLRPGELMWLNYTRLVPKSVETETVQAFEKLNSMLASPDKNWIAMQQTPESKAIDLYKISDEKKPESKLLTLPSEGVIPDKVKTSEIAEWDSGNRYFLLVYNKQSAPEFVVVDRTDEKKAVNITKKFNLKIDKAHFADDSGKAFFVSSEGDLRKANLDSATISEPLVPDVADFNLFKSGSVAFSAVSGTKRIAGVYESGADKPKISRTVKGTTPAMMVASDSYFGDDYLAVSQGNAVEVVKNPKSSKKVFISFMLKTPVKWLQFSDNGRFIMAQNGTELAVHDLEYGKTYHATLEAKKTPSRPAGWLDGYHFWSTDSGQVAMFDFDGLNRQTITDALPGYDLTLSSNGKRLFSVGQDATTKKPVLQSSKMVTED